MANQVFNFTAKTPYNRVVLDGRLSTTEVYTRESDNPDNVYQQWYFDKYGSNDTIIVHNATREGKKNLGLCADGKDGDKLYTATIDYSSIDNLKWELEPTSQEGWYKIKHVHSGYYVANKDTYCCLSDDSSEKDELLWELSIDWTLTIEDLIYDPYDQQIDGVIDMGSESDIYNGTDGTIDHEVSFSLKNQSSFTWSLTEKVGLSITAGFEAGVPGASATGEMSLSVEFGSSREWSTSTEATYTIADTVSIGPYKTVNIAGYLDWTEGEKIGFTMTSKVTATNTISNEPIGASDVIQILEICGLDGNTSYNGDTVTVETRGSVDATFGCKTYLKVTEKDS